MKWSGAKELQPMLVPIKCLKLDSKNVRTHSPANLNALANSLSTFGQQKPLVTLKDGTVIAGNGALIAAKKIGWKELAVVVYPDKKTAVAYALADNQTGLLRDWDFEMMAETFKDLQLEGFNLEKIGFPAHDIQNILNANFKPPAIHDNPITAPETDTTGIEVTKSQRQVVLTAIEQVRRRKFHGLMSDGDALVVVCKEWMHK